jgi:sec-independent protein translocase protein TatC
MDKTKKSMAEQMTNPLETVNPNSSDDVVASVATPATHLGEMSLMEHLVELRTRLLHVVVALVLGTCFTYSFAGSLFHFLTQPYFASFPASSLIGTGPAEAFMLKLKVALVAAVFVTSPYLFLQIWLFVAPGLYDDEKRLVVPFIGCATLLFLGGASLSYWVLLPIAFEFFLSQYQSIEITPQIRLSEHLALTLQVVLASGILFEFPLLTFLLARSGVITKQFLIDGTRYAIVATFVISAIVTPPDVITQILFAVPLLILYGVSILVAGYAEKR